MDTKTGSPTVVQTSTATSDAFSEIVGQPRAVGTLSRALAEQRIATAYLFQGPSGVGKARTALAFAAEAILQATAESLAASGGQAASEGQAASGTTHAHLRERLLSGNHADLRIFSPREDGQHNLQVDYVRREILPYTQYAPFEAGAAFLLFPHADVSFPEGHPEAANALLKTLEEPRAGVHFILIAERPERLLTTIRSRCQRVGFARLPDTVLRSLILKNMVLKNTVQQAGAEEPTLSAAVALADGRADRALTLAEDEHLSALLASARKLDEAAHAPAGTLVAAAEALARSEDRSLILDVLVRLYRDRAFAALGRSDLAALQLEGAPNSEPSALHAGAEEAPRRAAAAESARRVACIHEALDKLERNANPQLTCEALLFALGPERRRPAFKAPAT